MICFDILLLIAFLNKAFFKANEGKQPVYTLYLYLNEPDSTVLEGLLKSRFTTFHLPNNNLVNYNLWL